MIKIVDSIMGSGKSQMAIQMMNEDSENSFIYITPYLDEIRRIKENVTSKVFYEPKEDILKGIPNKTNSLKNLLKENKDIATTHSLFKIVDEQTQEILQATNYTLILDEVMDVVQQIPVTKADQKLLFEVSKILMVDENNQVKLGVGANNYIEEGYGKFSEIIHMARLGRLFKFEDVVLLWEFPVDVFKYFKQVYILTYLFDGQIQKYFFDFYDVGYEKYNVIKENNKYVMIPYDSQIDKNKKEYLKSKITIYEGNLNSIGKVKTALSYSWYKNAISDLKDMMQNNIYNYFKNIQQVKSKDCLWTSFKNFGIDVPSYKRAFIPHNLRATNEYSDTHTLAYCVNRFISPYLEKYFLTRNIVIDEDLYALSEMIQWIWRSRIRNDENINIYIPSKRMRELLYNFF